MNNLKIIIWGAFFVCNGCTPYAVDDRPPPICALTSDLSSNFVYSYYDSVALVCEWNNPPEKWRGQFRKDNDQVKDRVYFLNGEKPEMYYVQFTEPITIKAVFDGVNYTSWTYGENISENEKSRICSKFSQQVLDRMRDYGKKNNTPNYLIKK